MEIEKIEQTEEQINAGDPVQYVFKVARVMTDDYNNEITTYTKEIYTEEGLLADKGAHENSITSLNKQIDEINAKITEIVKIK